MGINIGLFGHLRPDLEKAAQNLVPGHRPAFRKTLSEAKVPKGRLISGGIGHGKKNRLNLRQGGIQSPLAHQGQTGFANSREIDAWNLCAFRLSKPAPEVEATWPHNKTFSATWGAGVALPVYQSDYPRTITPMGTVTLYFNGPFGYRGM